MPTRFDRSTHIYAAILKSILGCILMGTVVLCIASTATNKARFVGKWRDNTSSRLDRVGDMEILPSAIVFGRHLKYTVSDSSAFGNGELYKITGVNRRIDPNGCGPTEKVHYIIIEPISDDADQAESGLAYIRVSFYEDPTAPDPATIDDQITICETHPFVRGSVK